MKTAQKIQQELDTATTAMAESMQRMTELEQAGVADEKTIDEMGRLTNKGRLLQGAINRLKKELEAATVAELETAIVDLRVVAADEKKAADKAIDKLTAQAVKILVPDAGCTPVWNELFCKRRINEIQSFARQHPDVTKHIEAATKAKMQIEQNTNKLRSMAA